MSMSEASAGRVGSVSAMFRAIGSPRALLCLLIPLLCCARHAMSQNTRPGEPTIESNAHRSGVSEPGPANIESRIGEVTPSRPILGGARFATVSLLGYDLLGSVGSGATPRLSAGKTYVFVMYLEMKRHGDVGFELVTRLGNMFIGRNRIEVPGARPGEVIKKELNLRIPLTAPQGETPLYFSVLDTDPPVFAGGGTVEVENRRAPLVAPVRRPSAECLVRGNLIPNASFEDLSRQGDWIPDEERSKRVLGFSVVIDKAEAYHGTRSLMIDFHGGIDASVWVVKGVEVAVEPGREYTFGFYYKTQDLPPVPEGMRGPCVQIIDADDDTVRIALSDVTLPRAPEDWTKHERGVTIPESTDKIRIRVRRYGASDRPSQWSDPVKTYPAGGTVWIDCMWLVPHG